MRVLHLVFWPVLLLPAAWWGWHALHAPPAGLVLENGARLAWVDCWFDKPLWQPLFCARLQTAPDASAHPQTYSLPVVYIPKPLRRHSAPPLLYISGGPGGSSWLGEDDIGFWLDWIGLNDWVGDLVLYDQRGVGLSEPALDCPEIRATTRELLPLPLPSEEAYRRMRVATRACHDRLLGEGVSLDRLTTRHNAADAIDLLRAMGLQQADVYAVSYGTRVALEMMRTAPQQIRAAVLDSPYPPEVNSELSDAWLLQRVLDLFARICDLADECAESADDLREDLARAFERVQREGIKLSVRAPDTAADLAVVYDRDDFAWLLFEAMYQWNVIPELPPSVRALADGRLDSQMRELIHDSVVSMLDESISDAVAASVDCHDGGPVDARDAARELDRFPGVADIKRFDWQYHACRFWASGDAGEDFRSPVRSAVPSLLLAGEFDPVTPPEWAENAVRHLPNAQVFVFPAVGHGVLDSHVCAADLTAAFLADPANPVPPACLSRL
ncbi:MAG: alpha/beta fold hydrolase [Gammaproteobacteria bacterium]|nr:alpha/beta fold hydrolase [Gammaproteobacteria bacterium]